MQNWKMSRASGAASLEPRSPSSTKTATATLRPVVSSAKPANQAFSGSSVEPVLPKTSTPCWAKRAFLNSLYADDGVHAVADDSQSPGRDVQGNTT
jgi:hypothetical protein